MSRYWWVMVCQTMPHALYFSYSIDIWLHAVHYGMVMCSNFSLQQSQSSWHFQKKWKHLQYIEVLVSYGVPNYVTCTVLMLQYQCLSASCTSWAGLVNLLRNPKLSNFFFNFFNFFNFAKLLWGEPYFSGTKIDKWPHILNVLNELSSMVPFLGRLEVI